MVYYFGIIKKMWFIVKEQYGLVTLIVLLRSMFIYVDASLSFIRIKCEISPLRLAVISA